MSQERRPSSDVAILLGGGVREALMAQSVLPEAHQILIIGQDHHRIVVDAIENREGARAEAVMREHARLAARNLRLALRNRTHLDLLPALALIRSPSE